MNDRMRKLNSVNPACSERVLSLTDECQRLDQDNIFLFAPRVKMKSVPLFIHSQNSFPSLKVEMTFL